MRILLDNNVPVGVRRFLPKHEVRTVVEMKWSPRLENGELLKAAEAEGFELAIGAMVDEIMPGGLNFLEMPLPSKLSPGPETEE